MLNMRLKIFFLVLAIFAALVYLNSFNMKEKKLEKQFLNIKIWSAQITAEIADTPEKRARGLSGREALGKDEGMLFVFTDSAIRQFWMKDMNFSLDIIWIDENKKIIDITKNATPESYLSRAVYPKQGRGESGGPEKFSPSAPAKYVLEVSAGFADAHNIKIGDYAD